MSKFCGNFKARLWNTASDFFDVACPADGSNPKIAAIAGLAATGLRGERGVVGPVRQRSAGRRGVSKAPSRRVTRRCRCCTASRPGSPRLSGRILRCAGLNRSFRSFVGLCRTLSTVKSPDLRVGITNDCGESQTIEIVEDSILDGVIGPVDRLADALPVIVA